MVRTKQKQRGRCLGGVLRRRETLTHTGTQRTRGKKSLFVRSAPQAPRRVEFPALSRPRPSITGRRAASALPAAKVAFRQLPPRRAPAAVLRLTLLGLLTEEGGPESQQTLLNWTQSSARNQASGLFLPTLRFNVSPLLFFTLLSLPLSLPLPPSVSLSLPLFLPLFPPSPQVREWSPALYGLIARAMAHFFLATSRHRAPSGRRS